MILRGEFMMQEFMNYNFNISKILLCCYVPAGNGKSVHTNRASHGLAIHMSGNRIYHFKSGEELVVNKNDIIYLPKYSNYSVESVIAGDCYAINFDIPEEINFKPFVINSNPSEIIQEHFKKANYIWEQKNIGYEMKCKAELYNIIYSVVHGYFANYMQKNKLEMIQPAIDVIHKNYTTEPLNVSVLSKMCGITPEYFRKIFKNFLGVSPVVYINNLKISRAKELLKSNVYSITEVALMSGFNDMSYFSREFKKAVGVSPSEYKKT